MAPISGACIMGIRLRHFKTDPDEFGTNVLHINTHRLTKSDFWLNVKISKNGSWGAATWWVIAEVLLPGESLLRWGAATWWVIAEVLLPGESLLRCCYLVSHCWSAATWWVKTRRLPQREYAARPSVPDLSLLVIKRITENPWSRLFSTQTWTVHLGLEAAFPCTRSQMHGRSNYHHREFVATDCTSSWDAGHWDRS